MSAVGRIACILVALLGAAACQPARVERPAPSPAPPAPATTAVGTGIEAEPASRADWWRDRVFYEIFVRSFADSTSGPLANDGVGDLQGLIERLDYLNDGNPATTSDLGITGIWLMPINPSPSYHGYDVVDYYDVHPQYGTREDFRRLLAECHARGIRVIVDLVLNHSSSRHPQFTGALRDDPAYRDWYVFAPPDRVPQVRGPWDQVVWHEAHGKHYYGIFWSGMPDLNYRTPAVTAEAYRIAEFWLREMGADGFRLDAIRHLIEDGDAMSDTPETVAWLQGFQAHVKRTRPDALTVGEVWTGTEVVSEYVRAGALDLAFEFDLAAAIVDAAKSGGRDELADAIDQVAASYPDGRYATMITNHDQNRVASELGEDPARLKLAAGLLLTLPGVPFLYYGEEVGQVGAKPDEMIRNPMPWTSGRNGGFTGGARPWEPLQPGHERRNVATLAADPGSLLHHYRRLVRLRQSEPALSRGRVRTLETGRADVIAWERMYDDRRLTVVANLAASEIRGFRLPADAPDIGRDLLGGAAPDLGGAVTLAPHGLYVFAAASGLDAAAAARFAQLALDCVHKEYPNKVAHVLNSGADVKPPRELTPAFYGCYDWHSSVHGHWLLARLARLFPGTEFAAAARAALARSLTAPNVAAEVAYLQGAGRASFERPYGLAWLLRLAAELRSWDDPQARAWAETLAPLETEAAQRVMAWLPKLQYPIRSGEHSQTAFAFGLMADWSQVRGDVGLARLLEQRARVYYLGDRDCALRYEPSGEDFLSPCLAEADFMRRMLPGPEYAGWLAKFLPGIPRDDRADWLPPGVVTDRSDPKLAHIDGLNLSRAWMLEGIASGLPARDPRRAALLAAARAHADAALPAVTGEHYEGGHWLGTFAVYLTSRAGLRP